MIHAPFIIAAYVIAIGIPLFFAAQVHFRTRAAQRRLATIDPRQGRGSP